MKHISTTPFGRRPVTAGWLAARALAEAPAPADAPDKWTILRELTEARAAFGVTDRDLVVLAALLSFHPEARLDAGETTIVFPSNRSLASRAHGMAEATLRRHLAALVEAGLILRHDSPNGKRYARRGPDGALDRAFGFDLRPLLVRASEIAAAAKSARAAEARRQALREAVVLGLRDAAKLIAWARQEGLEGDWEALEARILVVRRALRRKLDLDSLQALQAETAAIVSACKAAAEPSDAEESSGNVIDFERHQQNSNQTHLESEPCQEQQEADRPIRPAPPPTLPLGLVLKACPDIVAYARHGIRHWHELVATAEHVRPMMGISADAWSEARQAMGPETAAITLAAMLQKGTAIARPGGYLRALTAKATEGGFSPGPMLMALLRAAG